MGRKKLLSKYEYKKPEEARLKALLDDLLALDDVPINRAILKNALRGYYANYSLYYANPAEVLQIHLARAAQNDSNYEKLVKKARNDEYDHYKGAKIKFDPPKFMNQFYPRGLAAPSQQQPIGLSPTLSK